MSPMIGNSMRRNSLNLISYRVKKPPIISHPYEVHLTKRTRRCHNTPRPPPLPDQRDPRPQTPEHQQRATLLIIMP